MDDRDEDGRPKAKRNAGAFLSPFGGMIPAPSDMIEGHWRGQRRERRRARRALLTVGVTVVIVLLVVLLVVSTPDAAAVLQLPTR